MIIPGLRTLLPARTRLAEALFSSVQRRVLALFFGQPERRFQSAEVIRLVKGGTGGVHRELRRLETAGWLAAIRIGHQKHYQANVACPAFPELRGLVATTIGPAGPPPENAPGRRSSPAPTPETAPDGAAGRQEEGEPPPPATGAPPKDSWRVW